MNPDGSEVAGHNDQRKGPDRIYDYQTYNGEFLLNM